MTYRGKVQGGVVVLEPGVRLDEGTEVRVEEVAGAEKTEPLSDMLMSFAGSVPGLPPDLAKNHDHYIHGTPKK